MVAALRSRPVLALREEPAGVRIPGRGTGLLALLLVTGGPRLLLSAPGELALLAVLTALALLVVLTLLTVLAVLSLPALLAAPAVGVLAALDLPAFPCRSHALSGPAAAPLVASSLPLGAGVFAPLLAPPSVAAALFVLLFLLAAARSLLLPATATRFRSVLTALTLPGLLALQRRPCRLVRLLPAAASLAATPLASPAFRVPPLWVLGPASAPTTLLSASSVSLASAAVLALLVLPTGPLALSMLLGPRSDRLVLVGAGGPGPLAVLALLGPAAL